MAAFEEAIALEELNRETDRVRFSGAVHPAFHNMMGPYGGWSAGVLANGLMKAVGPDFELVSLTVDFLNAVPDGAFELDVTCDRAGRGTQFWHAALRPDGQVGIANRATAVIARRRDTVEWTEGSKPDAPEPENCPRVEFVGWMEEVEIRQATNPPFQSGGDTLSSAWVRMAGGRALDPQALVTLADTPAPRLFHVMDRPDPIATVTMTVYLHATPEDYAAVGDDYLLVETNAARGGRGFFDQFARMWSRDGRLMATTQQVVWYRAKQEGTHHA